MARNLPEEFFENPTFQTFLNNIVRDRELWPEIRNGSLTVYYRGAALIRDLRLNEGRIAGQVHFKYIPVRQPERSAYITLQFGSEGFSLPQSLSLPIGFGDANVLSEYKRVMASVPRGPECLIVHEILCRQENLIIDQEIKFQVPGEGDSDKIDICHFDTHLGCLAFVEVKGIHDSRLMPGSDDVPEVVQQLRRYGRRIEEHQATILADYQSVVGLKTRLGLGPRLNGISNEGLTTILKKPVLVIGDCSRDIVAAITGGDEKWLPLLNGLRDSAAGLILCGSDGCRLNLRGRRQVTVFDQTVI
jgi:hypothetical protein